LCWAGGALLAAGVLMACYLRIAGTVSVTSDGAGNAIEAWDIFHHDLLLHGWWVTDVSFYTTELPQYALVEAVAGLRPEVVHICAAMTYTLLVLLAAFVARGRVGGARGAVCALIAGGVMLAPEPGGVTGVLFSSPDHVGTAVPVLVLLLLLDWARPSWWLPVLAFLLLTAGIVGDPLIEVIGVLPLAALCLARVASAVLRGRGSLRSQWYELSLGCAAIVAVPAAVAANRLIVALGGFSTNAGNWGLVSLATLRSNIPMAARSFLSLFGADVVGARGGLQQAFAVVHLAGAALVVAALALAAGRLLRSLVSPSPCGAGRTAARRPAAGAALAAAAGRSGGRPGGRLGLLRRHARVRGGPPAAGARERGRAGVADRAPPAPPPGRVLGGVQRHGRHRWRDRHRVRGAGSGRPGAVALGDGHAHLRPGHQERELRAVDARGHGLPGAGGARVRPAGPRLPLRGLHDPGLGQEHPAGPRPPDPDHLAGGPARRGRAPAR
jgi:hypothetical protein